MRLAADVRLVGLLTGHGEGADLTAHWHGLTHARGEIVVGIVSQ
jgi:hypothetical protein